VRAKAMEVEDMETEVLLPPRDQLPVRARAAVVRARAAVVRARAAVVRARAAAARARAARAEAATVEGVLGKL